MVKKKTAWAIRAFCLVAVSMGIAHQADADDNLPGLIGIQYGSDDFEEEDEDKGRPRYKDANGVAFHKRAGQMDGDPASPCVVLPALSSASWL